MSLSLLTAATFRSIPVIPIYDEGSWPKHEGVGLNGAWIDSVNDNG